MHIESDLWVYDEQIGSYFDKSKRTVFSREALVVARDVVRQCGRYEIGKKWRYLNVIRITSARGPER